MKLRWAALSGGSEKQLGDAMGVYELQRDLLDLNYIEHWASHLNLTSLWQRIKETAENEEN